MMEIITADYIHIYEGENVVKREHAAIGMSLRQINKNGDYHALLGKDMIMQKNRKFEENKKNKIKIDEFKWIIDRIRHYGEAYSIDLRNELKSRHSSMVTMIFANIPLFKVTYNPRKIVFSD